ncbi:pyridoxamine 5'-phosphate oxidase family protein [Kribbella sp. NPDC056861]|uniref:pyridoxamine 5'-phosphate oxidase family protein n=1 Tax=Kribbella sp. NPDC056861 TaxID=3154857 RepID=UPI00342B0B05
MVVEREFIETAHRIVWCTVATVDRQGRPRSRILHPYWEFDGDRLVGWIVTRPTPVKVAHLASTPYVSCSNWDPTQDVAIADCHAEWVTDAATRQRVWELYREAPAPLGFDFWSVFPDGPGGETVSLLRLTPYRLRITDVATLSGQKAPLTWP